MSKTTSFTANDFLALSKEIENAIKTKTYIKTSNESALIRSAISRAYYAAFLSLRRSILIANPKWKPSIKKGNDDHETLKLTLFSLPPAFLPLANKFNNLRKRRNNADYDLPPKFDANIIHAEMSNKEAENIINTISLITNYFSTQYP